MRKKKDKYLEFRIGTTDTNNHILSIVGFWCSQYTGSPFCPRLRNRRYLGTLRRILGYGQEAWEGNRHYEMPLLFKECPLLPGNRSVSLPRFEYLKQRFPSVKEQSGGLTQIFKKKKSQEKANLSKGGPKRASKKRGDQLIKKCICEETYDTSYSQNCLNHRPPSSPKREKALKARVDWWRPHLVDYS